ncbi:MAG: hypothetical protein ABFS18_01320 [Thermodesulfobacteriota bacterium]
MKILFTILVFLYLFAYGIKISGIPISVFISIMSVVYIGCYGLVPKFIKTWLNEIVLILFIFYYLFFLEALQGIEFSRENFSFYLIRILIDGVIPAYVLSDIAKKIKINTADFVYVLVAILSIEFIISVMMVFAPDFKSIIFIYVNGYSDQHVLMNEQLFSKRGFAIAYTYLAWFPFTVALIFSFCLFSNVIKSKIFLSLLAITVFILIALNARIGFIPLFIGLLIYIVFSGVQGIKRIASSALIIVFIFYLLSFFEAGDQFDDLVKYFRKWVIEDGFSSFFSQEGSETVKDLANFQILSDFSFSDFIFGRGDILVPEKENLYTDVGYIQTLYTGGLILSLSLYTLFILFAKRLIDVVRTLCAKGIISQIFIYFPLVICVSFLIGHVKLRIFEINEATRFLFLLVSFFVVLSEVHYDVPKFVYLKLKK